MSIKTIPIYKVVDIFLKYDFTKDEILNVLLIMAQLWKLNEFPEDITKEFIRTEMDLDELTAQMLINEVMFHLTPIIHQIRDAAKTGKLIRWNVLENNILLELSE